MRRDGCLEPYADAVPDLDSVRLRVRALPLDVVLDMAMDQSVEDLSVRRARYVPLDLKLEVRALPQYQQGQVKAALLARFSGKTLPGGWRGFFHRDELAFGEGIYLGKIIAAAQSVPGVECVRVTRFHRLFESPNHELEDGVLRLRRWEIAQLDNDPDHPERGQLEIQVQGEGWT